MFISGNAIIVMEKAFEISINRLLSSIALVTSKNLLVSGANQSWTSTFFLLLKSAQRPIFQNCRSLI